MGKFILFFVLLLVASLSVAQTTMYDLCKEVTGKSTHLKIIETAIQVKARSSNVYQIIVDDGLEYLQKTEGDCFNVVVENQTLVPTSLHWHGLIDPNSEDGVSYITQAPIPPGKSYPYNFKIVQSGTYFAHSHFGLHEQKLMSIPMILMPKEKKQYPEIILFFQDFTFQNVDQIWQELRKNYIAMAKHKGSDWKPSISTKMMSMKPDLSDVNYDAYLTNRKTLENLDSYNVKAGDVVRLRFINSSSSSGFHVNLGKLQGKLIAVDGNPVVPVFLDTFPLATAQRVDVLVSIPKEGGAFPLLAQGQGTNMVTGAILKTEDIEVPSISMETKDSIGAITNDLELKLKANNPLIPRKVDRKLRAELVGNMQYYVWAINNHVWPNNHSLFVKEGERVEIEFINKSGMSHPMHLHGHFFQIVAIDGKRFTGAVRDTVLVMPNQTVTVQFDANNPGRWAMHCHISYHMWGGMFTVLQYEGFESPLFAPSVIEAYSRIYH
ncbi:MAG TPA: multicopper oxidase family protein [Nitrosomonas mobilis]|nr:multicopper oxidase family protein [Nitrosomonas mobilis]